MDRRTFVKTVPALAMMAGASSACAEELRPIALPKPEKDGGKSVLAALWERSIPARPPTNPVTPSQGMNGCPSERKKPGKFLGCA